MWDEKKTSTSYPVSMYYNNKPSTTDMNFANNFGHFVYTWNNNQQPHSMSDRFDVLVILVSKKLIMQWDSRRPNLLPNIVIRNYYISFTEARFYVFYIIYKNISFPYLGIFCKVLKKNDTLII